MRQEMCQVGQLSHLSCTRIVIAHRLTTVRSSDQIVVLEAGEIVERGTDDSLLALDGHYADLVRAQTGNPATSPDYFNVAYRRQVRRHGH